ncbi:hypothetical protein [Halostreptopolyspora alba]|uniref:hypothetical protein n=1 Tax=Halostreptopolyspora alba TaxID=2487137 RepID=UPI003716013B
MRAAKVTNVERVSTAEATRSPIDLSSPVCLMPVDPPRCVPEARGAFGVARTHLDLSPRGSWTVHSAFVSDGATTAREFTETALQADHLGWRRNHEEAAAVESVEPASPSADDAFPAVPVECSPWRNGGTTPQHRPTDPDILPWETSGVAVKRWSRGRFRGGARRLDPTPLPRTPYLGVQDTPLQCTQSL